MHNWNLEPDLQLKRCNDSYVMSLLAPNSDCQGKWNAPLKQLCLCRCLAVSNENILFQPLSPGWRVGSLFISHFSNMGC